MSIPTETDYNGLFEALRNFQKGDQRFKDIDFEASGISSIIKLLAANSSAAALNAYFAQNESFVSTSEILSNVQALVTPESGYVPYGKRSSTIVCNIVITPPDANVAPATLTLPKTMTALAVGDGKTLNFTPKIEYEAPLQDSVYTFENVVMVEGQRVTNSFVQEGSAVLEFEIPNKDIDISTLEVSVRTSKIDATTEVYERFTSAFQLGIEEKLFFLSMNRSSKYKLEFGDGIFSKALQHGNIIYASYVVSNGLDGDGIDTLTPTSEVGGFSDITIQTLNKSKGGSEPESITSIKSNARFSQGMDGSAVSNGEYELKLKQLLPGYKVKAWGGEDAKPVRSGFVVFSTFPELLEVEQQEVTAALNKVSVGSILTTYTSFKEYGVEVSLFYISDGSTSNKSNTEKTLESIVKEFSKGKQDFGASFNPRELEELLESVQSVLRVNVSYTVESPVQVASRGFTFNYHRQIASASFESTFDGDVTFDSIKDTGTGFYKYSGGVQGEQVSASVNYTTGLVTISNIDTTSVSCTSNKATPAGDDYFLQVEPYELLNIELNGINTL